MAKKRFKLTLVSTWHYFRLVYRSLLFISLLVMYIFYRLNLFQDVMRGMSYFKIIAPIIWIVYMIEMIFRFFPSKLESPGCQKQFKRNYRKTGETDIKIQDNNGTMLVALIWVCGNCVLGVLHILGILDQGIMLLVCCAYAICDMICILFFCPFQSWILRNKCCSACRIYNWDYAMMFTPFFFVVLKGGFKDINIYAWSLLVMSIILLVRWEITFYLYPERFSPNTNAYLHCENCTERLCTHKKQLRSHWDALARFAEKRIKKLSNKQDNIDVDA